LTEFFSFFLTGALLGLTAGISPGPVLTLVISETIRKNRQAGIKVALSPLITDFPIILISLLLLSGFDQSRTALGIIALAGALFLLYLGYDCLKFKDLNPDLENPGPGSLMKGAAANLLNPHPYLFWITVGAPIVFKAWQVNGWAVAAFFLSFYLFLVGSKIMVALLVHRSKAFLNSRGYTWIIRGLGIILFIFALFFLLDGIKMLSGS